VESEEENKQTGESILYYILTVCMHWITTRSSVHLRKYRQCKCENLENKFMDPIDNYMYQVLGGHRQAQRRHRKRQPNAGEKAKRQEQETNLSNPGGASTDPRAQQQRFTNEERKTDLSPCCRAQNPVVRSRTEVAAEAASTLHHHSS
jgi:hypothetical protein